MSEVTIAGQTFEVPAPYKEGDVLSANEASALNQTFQENIRNNMATKVKEGTEAGMDHAVLQSQIADYCEAYEFGVRSGGGGRRDPVRAEAFAIALDTIKSKIKSLGRNVSQYSPTDLRAKAKEMLDSGKYQQIWEMAKDRVEQQKAAAKESEDDLNSLLDDLQPTAPAEQAA